MPIAPHGVRSVIHKTMVGNGHGPGDDGVIVGVLNGHFVVALRWSGRLLQANIAPEDAKGIFDALLTMPEAVAVMKQAMAPKQ